MSALSYVGRAPDSDGIIVPKSYADTTNTGQALTTTQVNNQIAATTPSLTVQSYVDAQDAALAHKAAVTAADANYVAATLLNAANGVAGLDGSGDVLSAVLPPTGTVLTDRVIASYSLAAGITLDAIGTAALTFNTSHTTVTLNGAHSAAGGTANLVLAYVDAQTNESADSGAATLSAVYGTTAMTPVPGSQLNYSHPATGLYGNVGMFYLFNPPTGSKTVAYTVTTPASGSYFVTGQTVSYNNVASLGTLVTNTGAATNTAQTLTLSSVPCPTNGLVTMMFATGSGAGAATLGSFTGTQRYNNNTASTGAYMLIGDAAGASTETFTANLPLPSGATVQWTGLGLPLNPVITPGAIGTTFITAPVTITSTSTVSKLASIVIPDPGWPWRPVPQAWVMGDSSGSSVPANRNTGTGSYGVLTVAPPGSGTQVYGLGICTGSYYTNTYPVGPYAAASQTPTSVPAVTGSLELDLNASLWSGTTYTFYPDNLMYEVLVVPAL